MDRRELTRGGPCTAGRPNQRLARHTPTSPRGPENFLGVAAQWHGLQLRKHAHHDTVYHERHRRLAYVRAPTGWCSRDAHRREDPLCPLLLGTTADSTTYGS